MADVPEDLQERIAAYIDGELSPAEAARLEVFLANTDPGLADQVVGMLADKTRLRNSTRPMAPRDLSARIMEQIERASLLRDADHDEVHRHRWWQSKMAVAAGVALVVGGFGYFIASSVLSPTNTQWRESVASKETPQVAAGPVAPPPAAPAVVSVPTATAAPAPAAAPVVRALDQKRTGGETERLVADAGKMEKGLEAQKAAVVRDALGDRAGAAENGPRGGAALRVRPENKESLGMVAAGNAALAGTVVNKPAKALELVNAESNDQPIVMTFAPMDAAEAGRLTDAIDQLVLANRKEMSLTNNEDRATVSNGWNGGSNGVGAAGGARSQGGFGGKQSEFANNTAQQLYSNQMGGGGGGQQGRVVEMRDKDVKSLAEVPLRVQLKPEQAEKLAQEYKVALVARGGTSYLFEEKDKAPVTADARSRGTVLRRAGYGDAVAAEAEKAPATTAPAASTVAAALAASAPAGQAAADAPAQDGLKEYVITIEPRTAMPAAEPATTVPAEK